MNAKKILIALLLCSLCLQVYLVNAPVQTSNNFMLYVGQNGKIGFQHDLNSMLQLSANAGNMNSSNAVLTMGSNNGKLTFTSNETFTLSYNSTENIKVSVTVNGEGKSGLIPVVSTDVVVIYWVIMVQPVLPIMFIFGMVGLVSMFGGILYPIHIVKKEHDYQRALVAFCTFFFLGFGLFIAWVFMA